jgi:hypothetical protein
VRDKRYLNGESLKGISPIANPSHRRQFAPWHIYDDNATRILNWSGAATGNVVMGTLMGVIGCSSARLTCMATQSSSCC